LDRRLGGPKNRSRRGGEEKNSQPPPGTELNNFVIIIKYPYIFKTNCVRLVILRNIKEILKAQKLIGNPFIPCRLMLG
jgi:hypothetical protein